MKFEKLLERAKLLDCDYIVTGHYARIEKINGKFVLKKAMDDNKDQSYVLYNMTQEQLAHTMFPLGNISKPQVRKIAESCTFANANKPDSQDICFVPDGNYAKVIETMTGIKPKCGDFVDKNGNVLGQHKGIIHYTIGQRKGLGISYPEPLFVCKICSDKNEVVLGSSDDLKSKITKVRDFNWISGVAPTEPFRCKVRIRYKQDEQSALILPNADGTVTIEFDEFQRAITSGQAAVLYDGDIVLGGGTII